MGIPSRECSFGGWFGICLLGPLTHYLQQAAAVAMAVTGIALLGSFGLEHCSSGRIHVYD